MSEAPDTGSIDWSQISFPDLSTPASAFVMPPAAAASPTSFTDAITNVADSIAKAAGTYYNTEAAINTARSNARVAAAQGQNAIATAKAGLPSPTLLLFGGLGLAAVLLLSKGK